MIKVYINSRLEATINDPAEPKLFSMTREEELDEARRVVGNSPFGSCKMCVDENGVMDEFLCF